MTDPSVSLRLRRDAEAPSRARAVVIDRFRERLGARVVYDVALVVSELVTNSVSHPGPGPELGVEVDLVGDHVLVAVSDRDAQLVPRPSQRGGAQQLGLMLVDQLAGSWGVARDGVGRTKIWCELPVDPRYG
jgi:two-component sensor histidine kinase